MKLIRYAAILLFASACSRQPAVQDHRDNAQPAPETVTKPAVPEQKPPATERKPPAAPKPAARDDRPVGTTASTVVDGKVVNTDAMVMADFKARVDRYLDVRKKAKKDAPPLKETKEPAKIKAARKGSRRRDPRAARRRQAGRHFHAGDPRRLPPPPLPEAEGRRRARREGRR